MQSRRKLIRSPSEEDRKKTPAPGTVDEETEGEWETGTAEKPGSEVVPGSATSSSGLRQQVPSDIQTLLGKVFRRCRELNNRKQNDRHRFHAFL